jgi:hypothetical protein
MNDQIPTLLERIQQLERELRAEIKKKETQFGYEVRDRKAHFTAAVAARHRNLARAIGSYVRASILFNVLTAAFVWIVLVPVVMLHVTASVFQSICFPVYGIPKVR